MSYTLMFKAEYLIIAFYLVLLAPFSVNAQGVIEPVEAMTVANISLSEATILSKEPGKLRLSFILTNQGAESQLDIRYGFELIKTTDNGQIIADTFVMPETLSLAPGQSISKEVDYFAPTFLTGDYNIYVIAKTSSGLMLSLANAGLVTFSEDVDFVEIIPESCSLNISGESNNYTLYQGVDVSVIEPLSITCEVVSHLRTTKSFTPYFETFRRSLYGDPVAVINPDTKAVSVAADEKRTVSFLVPKATKPQSYDATLLLIDATTNAPVSNKVSFHYVIRGESATIQNVFLDESSYLEGSLILANVLWTPSADQFPGSRLGQGTELDNVTAVLQVNDKKGNICAKSEPVNLSANQSRITIATNAVIDCVSPVATISIIDKNRNILDSWIVESPEQGQKSAAPITSPSGNSTLKLIILSLVITSLVIFVGVMVYKTLKRGSSVNDDGFTDSTHPYKILLFILLLSSSFLTGADQVSAVTFYGQNGFLEYTANANKSSYSPNETIYLDSAIFANVCNNTLTESYLKADFEGQSITLQSGSISGGDVLYGGGQLTAPSSPGVYLIVLKGCGGDNCYATPPQGVYYSSIPIIVTSPAMTPSAWWSPTNISISSGGVYTFGYASLGATKCDIWKNGTLVGNNVSTWSTFSNLTANEPSYTSRLICYGPTGTPSTPVDFTLTVLQSAVNGSCGNANGVQALVAPTTGLCSAGTQSAVVNNTNSYNWSCFGQNGGLNNSCSAPKPSSPTAIIDAPNCVIDEGGSSCPISVTWSSLNSNTPSVRQDGTQFSTLSSSVLGTSRNIGYGVLTFAFYDNGNLVQSDEAEAFCATDTTWNGSVCEPNPAPDLTSTFILSGTVTEGTAIPLIATVTNIGSLNSGSFSDNFSYWNGSSWIDINPFIVHPSLNGGGAQSTDNGSFTPTQTGTLLLQHCVDSYDQINESSEANCTQVSVTVIASTAANVDLSGYGCDIMLGGTDCNGKFSWNIQGAGNPNIHNLTTNISYSTTAALNDVSRPLQHGKNVIAAREGSNVLQTIDVYANCIAGTVWNGGTCVVGTLPPQISIEANPKIIRTGQTASVKVNITANYAMSCTLRGVNTTPIIIPHSASVSEMTYPYTTRPLTSAQIVQVSCSDGSNVTTKEVRIDMIGTIQEI